jgi:hypothetical protein
MRRFTDKAQINCSMDSMLGVLDLQTLRFFQYFGIQVFKQKALFAGNRKVLH